MEGSADEFAIPELWGYACQNVGYGLYTPSNLIDHRWGSYYRFISQCHLFLQELENAKGVTDADKVRWTAEAKFLIAYYHFEVLRFYGPCPITDSYIAMDTPNSQYNGRSHYDYVTNWIVDLLDEAAFDLPTTIRDNEWGRATVAIAKAIKARALVYAASPLWNGEFPYPNWTNKVETPGYGTELVSRTYDSSKWERALTACNQALEAADAEGFELFRDESLYSSANISLPYIPGMSNNEEFDAFKKKVMLMRYVINAKPTEGNRKFVWGLNVGNDGIDKSATTFIIPVNTNLDQSAWNVESTERWMRPRKSITAEAPSIAVSVDENTGNSTRTAQIKVTSNVQNYTITVTQYGANDVVVGEDIQVKPYGGKASEFQPGYDIDKTYDGKFTDGTTNSHYHSRWNNQTSFPVTLEYFFRGETEIDYLIYYSRSGNGNFGEVDIYTTTEPGRSNYTLQGDYLLFPS